MPACLFPAYRRAMRRILLALTIWLIAGPAPWRAFRFPQDNFTQAMTVHPLDMADVGASNEAGELPVVRGWELTSPHSRFGGFSALAFEGQGRLLLVSDNGHVVRFSLNSEGKVAEVQIAPLPSPDGQGHRKSQADAEAVTVDSQSGKIWVALEGRNEIWRLNPALSRIEARTKLKSSRWPGNRGPEAMARLGDGRTIVISEGADKDPRGVEALLYDGDPAEKSSKAIRFFYDARGKGAVSDAAALPEGRVLLIHRRLGFFPIFTTYVAILDPAHIAADAVVRSRGIGRVPRALAENYEGAAVTMEQGRPSLWLVSDNNFQSWQRSLLVQFRLDIPPAQHSKKAAP